MQSKVNVNVDNKLKCKMNYRIIKGTITPYKMNSIRKNKLQHHIKRTISTLVALNKKQNYN